MHRQPPYRLLPCLAIAWLLASGSDLRGNHSLSGWRLEALTDDFSDPGGFDLAILTDVASPFDMTSVVAVGPNTNLAHYEFLFDESAGDFLVSLDHHIGTSSISESLDGRVLVHTTSDVLLTVDTLLNYSGHPANDTLFDATFRVNPESLGNPSIFSLIDTGGTVDLAPAVGTLNLSGEFVLPAGGSYWLRYFARSLYLDETTPLLPIEMDGTIHWTLTAIPEPFTALLLLLVAPLLHRTRRA